MSIEGINTHILNVSSTTNWIFVTAHASDGRIGLGEASLNGMEPIVRECVRMQAAALVGNEIEAALNTIEVLPHGPGGLAWSAASSGIEQALMDLLARARAMPVHALLGPARRDCVAVYATIDRATVDRSPQGYAESARAAIAQGFRAIKVAPFDGVLPRYCSSADGRRAIETGIERVVAIRAVADPSIDIMVDCHWRFDAAAATRVLLELDHLGVKWIECPVSEQPSWWPVLKRLRALANERGMRIAGGEKQIGLSSVRPLLAQGLLDVIMSDVKVAGGYRETLRIAQLAAATNTAFSLHNPSGPVGNFASLHLSACVPEIDRLEYQLGESVLFFDAVRGVGPKLNANRTNDDSGLEFLIPNEPGLGLSLDLDVLARHPYVPVPISPNPRLG